MMYELDTQALYSFSLPQIQLLTSLSIKTLNLCAFWSRLGPWQNIMNYTENQHKDQIQSDVHTVVLGIDSWEFSLMW